eukprot:tig00020681_g12836.t1
MAAIGIVAPTEGDSPLTEVYQAKLLAHIMNGDQQIEYSIKDTLLSGVNKTSFWAFYLGATRVFVDDFGDLIVHVRRLGHEPLLCETEAGPEPVTAAPTTPPSPSPTPTPNPNHQYRGVEYDYGAPIGCLPSTTGILVLYTKEQAASRKRGCLEKQSSPSNYLLDVHDVFVGRGFTAALVGESTAGWKGWEDADQYTEQQRLKIAEIFGCYDCSDWASRSALPRVAIRMFIGPLTLSSVDPSTPYPGYLPSSPDLCEFYPTNYETFDLGPDLFAISRLSADYPYPAGFAFSPKTCKSSGKEYLVAGGEGAFWLAPIEEFASRSVTMQAKIDLITTFFANTTALEVFYDPRGPQFLAFGTQDLLAAQDCSMLVGILRQDGREVEYIGGRASAPYAWNLLFKVHLPAAILPGTYTNAIVQRNASDGSTVNEGMRIITIGDAGGTDGNLATLTVWERQSGRPLPKQFSKFKNPLFTDSDSAPQNARDPDLALVDITFYKQTEGTVRIGYFKGRR